MFFFVTVCLVVKVCAFVKEGLRVRLAVLRCVCVRQKFLCAWVGVCVCVYKLSDQKSVLVFWCICVCVCAHMMCDLCVLVCVCVWVV